MSNANQRGGNHYATFQAGTTVASSTVLNVPLYVTASNTVDVLPAAVGANIPIGTLVEKAIGGTSGYVTVDLFYPTKKAIGGASITGGSKLTIQSGTGYYITAAGTLTGVPIAGVAVTGCGGSGQAFEMFPVFYTGIVIA